MLILGQNHISKERTCNHIVAYISTLDHTNGDPTRREIGNMHNLDLITMLCLCVSYLAKNGRRNKKWPFKNRACDY
jgi:hypothetical protein